MVRTLMPDFEAIIRKIYSGANEPGEATFSKWIERAQKTRATLLENKQRNAEDLKGMKGTWADRVIDEKRQAYQREEAVMADVAKESVRADLEAVIAQKELQYSKAMSAPTEDQIRLLTVLKMRAETGEDLTSSDFAGAVGSLAGNYHCLKTLQNLANKAGVAFPQIRDDFRQDVETVRQAASNVLQSIDTPTDDLEYTPRLFWTTGSVGLQQSVMNKLDSLAYLSTTPEAVEKAGIAQSLEERESTESVTGANAEYCSKVRFRGNENIDAVCGQFHVTKEEVKALNPDTDIHKIFAGKELYIPSTRFTYMGHNTACVQDDQVTVAKTPVFTYPTGPSGEEIGEDIMLDI